MSSKTRLLILSAGRGIGLDGYHKLKLVAPSSGETILDMYKRHFGGHITVVVGYRAPELMAENPDLGFCYNYNWFETGSAFSAHLGLAALNAGEPVLVVPSDLFISDEAARQINAAEGNVIFTRDTENRDMNAVNVAQNPDGTIASVYSGPKRGGDDDQFCGIAKIADADLRRSLSASCEEHPSLAFSECLDMHRDQFRAVRLNGWLSEINSVEDYMEFFESDRARVA